MAQPAESHTAQEINDLTFRESMQQLEQIVAQLESNELDLETSLAQYERGIALLRHLRTSLNTAQQKVEVLLGELESPAEE